MATAKRTDHLQPVFLSRSKSVFQVFCGFLHKKIFAQKRNVFALQTQDRDLDPFPAAELR